MTTQANASRGWRRRPDSPLPARESRRIRPDDCCGQIGVPPGRIDVLTGLPVAGPWLSRELPGVRAALIGTGTASNPCRTPTPPGSSPDPSCVSARYVDSDGNVIFYLAQAQAAATSGNAGTNAALSVTDVATALAALSANSR